MTVDTSTDLQRLCRPGETMLLSFEAAVLKGILEAATPVQVLAGASGGALGRVLAAAAADPFASLLAENSTRVLAMGDPARAVTLAGRVAMAGERAVAMVENRRLERSLDALRRAAEHPLHEEGGLVVVLEDDPQAAPVLGPRRAIETLNMSCIEPGHAGDLREFIEYAFRLSRAGRQPVAIIVHRLLVHSADSLVIGSNRVSDAADVAAALRRRRGPRWGEAGGTLRMARRLELNRSHNLPSPGERVPVGFIAAGPAHAALQHLVSQLQLVGRVPILQLGFTQPADDGAIDRMLERCERIVVLEPRPGVLEASVVRRAEILRHHGQSPGSVWGAHLPPDQDGVARELAPDESLHPSRLARKIVHLLHLIRPTVQVARQLTPSPPDPDMQFSPRGRSIGSAGAMRWLHHLFLELDAWLRDRAPLDERGVEPTALVIEGRPAERHARRLVQVEAWTHDAFVLEGAGAVRQASQSKTAWIFVICDFEGEESGEVERLARAAVPLERTAEIESLDLDSRAALRDRLREATLQDGLTVLVLRDPAPSQYDTRRLESTLAEIDRLGYPPQQTIVRAADQVCGVRGDAESPNAMLAAPREQAALRSDVSVDRISGRVRVPFRFRIRPMLERIDVLRTQPPANVWHGIATDKLEIPRPLHAAALQWRCHLAGFRGAAPGFAATALSRAGRRMGYHVRTVHEPTAIGPGLRAWSQILFTRARDGDDPLPLTTITPYGEADVLLGLDAEETLRAISPGDDLRIASPDRTHVVADVGRVERREQDLRPDQRQQFRQALRATCMASNQFIDDVSDACRSVFHSDRVTDIALLGIAYQLRLIPTSLEALEGSIGDLEEAGCGRGLEVFAFGRRLAIERLDESEESSSAAEDLSRTVRRLSLLMSRQRGGARRSPRFIRLVRTTLDAMPGLTETDAGRAARQDFVHAAYRCEAWGRIDYARKYAALVQRVYDADRGDRGRGLTRSAILPLGEAMLIRDPIFVATMTRSPEQRFQLRRGLNVRHGREDRIERRYLTRFELVAFGRRVRADVRTSDWPAAALARFGRLVPQRWRGRRRDRQIRSYVERLLEQAIVEAGTAYDTWLPRVARLHRAAVDGRLRSMPLVDLETMLEAPSSGGEAASTGAGSI